MRGFNFLKRWLFVVHNTDTLPPPLPAFALSVVITEHDQTGQREKNKNTPSCRKIGLSIRKRRRILVSRCNGTSRGEARRAATGVLEQSSSQEGTLHHITSVAASPSQSVVTSCVVGLCALLRYWNPTHSSRHHLLVQCRSRENGVSTATSRE